MAFGMRDTERRLGRGGFDASRRGLAGVGVLLTVSLALAGCGGGKASAATETDAAAEPAVILQQADIAVAERAELHSGVELRGTLRPHEIVEVRAQVPGVVSQLRVDRGDVVRRGQELARIEAEGIRSQAAGARAQVAAAESNVALARQQLESARMLNEAGALSDLDLRAAEAGYEAAQGQLAAARAQAAGAVEAAQRATVTAPMDGAVSERAVSEGEAVNPGQSLFTVVNSESLELAGHIPVQQALLVHPGQAVRFTLDAYPDRSFEGTVGRVEPMADTDTRQVGVYLRLPNRGGRLIGGLFATGRVLTETIENALVLPAAAVRTQGGEPFVWVIEEGAVHRRPVVTGAEDAARGVVQIVSGIEEGERVLVSQGEVTEGMRVRVTPAAPAEPVVEEVR